MARPSASTGLEAAPDIMLLTMAALMVAIVWLVSHAHERTLPPVELPHAGEAQLGTGAATAVHVTLHPEEGVLQVYVDEARVEGGLSGLEQALRTSEAGELILRADADTRWEDSLAAMNVAARLELPLSVAGQP